MQSRTLLGMLFLILLLNTATSGLVLPISSRILNIDHPVLALASQLSSSQQVLVEFGFITILLPYLLGVIFFSAAADKWGRSKVLNWCLKISCLGYVFLLIGTVIKNIYLPLLGMTFLAIGSATIPIIQACIADFSDGLKKSYAFAITAAIFTSAYVPSAQLGNHLLKTYPNFIDTASITVIATLLSVITLVLGRCLLNSLKLPMQDTRFSGQNIAENFIKIFSTQNLCILLSTLLLFQFAWGLYFQNIYYYLIHYPQFTPEKACFFTTYLCGTTAGILILIYPIIIRKQSLKNILLFSLLTCGAAFLLHTIFYDDAIQYLLGFFIAAGSGMAMSALWDLISDTLDRSYQGFLMGLTAVIWIMTWALSSVIASFLNSYNVTLPLKVAAIFMLIAALRIWSFKNASVPAPVIRNNL